MVEVGLKHRSLTDRYFEIRYEDLCNHAPAGIETLSRVLDEPRESVRERVKELGSHQEDREARSPRALGLVMEWAALHREELREIWSRAQNLEPLGRIDPLR